jgi:hypothetical protein
LLAGFCIFVHSQQDFHYLLCIHLPLECVACSSLSPILTPVCNV